MIKRIGLALGLLLAASPVEAQDTVSRLSSRLDDITGASALQGYSLDDHALSPYALAGVLGPSETVALVVNLWAGRSYRVTGVCDRSCSDLDLGIRDPAEDGAAIAEDRLADTVPLLEFVARRTGPHLLKVEMSECAEEECYFSLRVLSQ